MENASKALIIAGAILLAIVIISLGLIVVNNVRETADTTNLSEQEIQSFNAKFTPYEGSNVSGSRVNTLIQQVVSTNQASYDAGKNHFVTIGFPSISKEGYIQWVGFYNGKIMYKKDWELNSTNIANLKAGKISFFKYGSNPFNDSALNLDTLEYALSVNTGKKYTVNLHYNNGLVKAIAVYDSSL